MYTFYGNNLRGERKKKNNNKESPIFPLIYFGLASVLKTSNVVVVVVIL